MVTSEALELKEQKESHILEIENKFGKVKVNLDKRISLPFGLLGIPDAKNYCLAEPEQEKFKIFKLLQSLDDKELVFLTFPLDIHNEIIDTVDLEEATTFLGIPSNNLVVLLIASSRQVDGTKRITVNSRAPIFLDVNRKTGIQFVLPNSKYQTQHLL